MPKKDFSQVAFDVVRKATGEATEVVQTERQKNSRKGGLKGGATRAATLTPEQRADIARTAALARWKKSP
jgi:hypothetical protein